MYVDCPACQTRLEVRASHLRAARGMVCCSICKHHFDALEGLRDDDPLPRSPLPVESIDADDTKANPVGFDQALDPQADTVEWPTVEVVEPTRPDAPPMRRRIDPADWRWLTMGVLAGGLLGLQVLMVFGPRWLADPDWRPFLDWNCARLQAIGVNCRLPPLIDLRQLTVDAHRFTTHPQRNGGLLFEAELVNHASYAQGYPRLRLSVEDPWGGAMAIGTFGPETYVPEFAARGAVLVPGERVPIRLELLDPGREAAGYRFELVEPE